MADGLREAKEAGTEELLSVVKKAKEKKATEGKKYKELFPDVPYTYSQASSELNKRHYHVQWASDLQEALRRLRVGSGLPGEGKIPLI